MVVTKATTAIKLPLTGTGFIRFALDVIDFLKAEEPLGLDKDGFLQRYFQGKSPKNPATREAWWDEFKRAAQYSTKHFNQGEVGWAWIRARPGRHRGQFYYHVITEVVGDRIKYRADAVSLSRLEPYTTKRWLTQTESRQRVRSAEGLALIRHGQSQGDQRLIDKGQDILHEFIMISPGLAALNFDTGMVTADLRRLASSPNPYIQLINKPIKRALDSAKRLERDVNRVVDGTLALAQIYQSGSQKALP